MYFAYGEQALFYLRKKDKRLCEVIDRIGHIDRTVDPDLFSSVCTTSSASRSQRRRRRRSGSECRTRWARSMPKPFWPQASEPAGAWHDVPKAAYITDFAERVHTGAFDLDAVAHMSDEAAIRALSSLKGIGVWTAEMILLFCLQRPDIFSYDDLAIRRGLRMVYHHREIDRDLFEKYRRRFCPYCSVASLYLWAVSGGAIPEMKDYKQKSK